jgi:glutamate/tyrosine decarboxylase-like PLP-dependent enzyme
VPEISRRFRALADWCALRAAGDIGYREIVERSLRTARDFGTWVSAQPDLELMGPVHLNIVCFRFVAKCDDDLSDAITARRRLKPTEWDRLRNCDALERSRRDPSRLRQLGNTR